MTECGMVLQSVVLTLGSQLKRQGVDEGTVYAVAVMTYYSTMCARSR